MTLGHLEEQRTRHRAWRERLAECEARRNPGPGPDQYRLREWEVGQALPRDEAWLRDMASGVPPPAGQHPLSG